MTTIPVRGRRSHQRPNPRRFRGPDHRLLADPIGQIARQSGVDAGVVIERIAAMLRSRNHPPGSPNASGDQSRPRRAGRLGTFLPDKLNSAFDWMFQNDPFSGHVVIRSTDSAVAGSKYRLWTTLKVPQGFSMQTPLPASLRRAPGPSNSS